MANSFIPLLMDIPPIRLKEPLALTLGAFRKDEGIFEYTFSDIVKMAGHACPTVSGAWVICYKALGALYPGEIPVRGEIEVTVFGDLDEGVYGVMAQVFSFITGAAHMTGFKGLGYKFRRKDLLKFNPKKPDPEALSFQFKRLDNKHSVLVTYYPQRVPFLYEKKLRLGELMEKVIWEAAQPMEIAEFRQLWMEKVEVIINSQIDIDQWLRVEERKD